MTKTDNPPFTSEEKGNRERKISQLLGIRRRMRRGVAVRGALKKERKRLTEKGLGESRRTHGGGPR